MGKVNKIFEHCALGSSIFSPIKNVLDTELLLCLVGELKELKTYFSRAAFHITPKWVRWSRAGGA